MLYNTHNGEITMKKIIILLMLSSALPAHSMQYWNTLKSKASNAYTYLAQSRDALKQKIANNPATTKAFIKAIVPVCSATACSIASFYTLKKHLRLGGILAGMSLAFSCQSGIAFSDLYSNYTHLQRTDAENTSNYIKIREMILTNKINIAEESLSEGESLFNLMASKFDDADLIQHIINKGVPVDGPGFPYPLAIALYANHFKVAQCLLSNNVNINEKDLINGRTLIKFFCEGTGEKSIRPIEWLIKNDADIHIQDIDGYTPLHYTYRNPTAAQLLIKNGADINNADNIDQDTPLQMILKSLSEEYDVLPTMLILLEAGAHINHVNLVGKSALHSACEGNKNKTVIATLLYYGAHKNSIDRFGKKAVDYATDPEIIDLLNSDKIPTLPTQVRQLLVEKHPYSHTKLQQREIGKK